jgi:hypothetical protein
MLLLQPTATHYLNPKSDDIVEIFINKLESMIKTINKDRNEHQTWKIKKKKKFSLFIIKFVRVS